MASRGLVVVLAASHAAAGNVDNFTVSNISALAACTSTPAFACNNPSIKCYSDPACLSQPPPPQCKAGGVDQICRYCGSGTEGGGYVECPSSNAMCASTPAFACNNPSIKCYSDPACLSQPPPPQCKAGGVDQICRYCGSGTEGGGYVECPSSNVIVV